MSDCVFCKIVDKKIPSCLVAEDDNTMAFMDIMPARKGHVLVVPRRHSETMLDVPAEDLVAMTRMVKRVSMAVQKAMEPAGFSVVQLNGAASGQTVFHIHFHVIPRRVGDGLAMKWSHETYLPGEIEKYQAKIVKELNNPLTPSTGSGQALPPPPGGGEGLKR